MAGPIRTQREEEGADDDDVALQLRLWWGEREKATTRPALEAALLYSKRSIVSTDEDLQNSRILFCVVQLELLAYFPGLVSPPISIPSSILCRSDCFFSREEKEGPQQEQCRRRLRRLRRDKKSPLKGPHTHTATHTRIAHTHTHTLVKRDGGRHVLLLRQLLQQCCPGDSAEL